MDLEKDKVVLNWLVSADQKHLQCLLSFANFYRRFIDAVYTHIVIKIGNSSITLPIIVIWRKYDTIFCYWCKKILIMILSKYNKAIGL